MRCQSGRGMSLGRTLLAVGVLSLLAFALASLSVTHLRLSSRQERGLSAANAARSAISAAVSKILQTQEFGKGRLPTDEIRLETADAVAILTFDKGVAAANGLAYSTNNLFEDEDTSGNDGVLVPSATAHLVAVARSGGVERTVEAVLRLPPGSHRFFGLSPFRLSSIRGSLAGRSAPRAGPPREMARSTICMGTSAQEGEVNDVPFGLRRLLSPRNI